MGLIVIPIILFLHFFSIRSRKANSVGFSNFQALARIKGIDIYSKNISVLVLTIIICTLIVFSMSGLTWQRQVNASAFSFVIAIDSSKSMEATDILPSRMDAAKESANAFIDNVGLGSKIGVISFSGSSFIEHDISYDYAEIKRAVNGIKVSSISGTDLYEALITSTNLLKNEDQKAIVLVSDGQTNIGDLDKAIEYLNKNGVIVYSIGIGTEQGGNTSYGLSKIDEASLKAIAVNTGGSYYRATSDVELTNNLIGISKTNLKSIPYSLERQSAILAIILIVLLFFLVNNKYRILP
jgi:Ca-activated chloride channel family protein